MVPKLFVALCLCLCASVAQSAVGFGVPAPAITALAFSPDGKQLAVGTFGQVVVFDTSSWQPGAVFTGVDDAARSLAFAPDSKSLAIGCGIPGESGRVLVWDLASPKPTVAIPAEQDTVEALAFRKDGKALLLGANDNKAGYYSALPSLDHSVLDEHNGRVTAVAFSTRDDWVFATGGMDKIVKIWDQKTRKTVVNFDQAEGGITGLGCLPDGNRFVGSSLDGRLYWWQVYYSQRQKAFGGSLIRKQDGHEGGILAMSMSGDGKRIVTGGMDRAVIVWNAENGSKIQAFIDSTQPIYAVALSPDGKLAAGAGREGVVRIWDVDANKLVTTLTPPPIPKTTRK